MNVIPIQVTQKEVMIPLAYFPPATDLELVIEDNMAVVRARQNLPKLHQDERRTEMLQQTAVFNAKLNEFQQHYLNEYVAIHNGELIDHDTDHTNLLRRINAKFPHQVVLIRQVTDTLPSSLNLGSPRLER